MWQLLHAQRERFTLSSGMKRAQTISITDINIQNCVYRNGIHVEGKQASRIIFSFNIICTLKGPIIIILIFYYLAVETLHKYRHSEDAFKYCMYVCIYIGDSISAESLLCDIYMCDICRLHNRRQLKTLSGRGQAR